MNIIVSVYQPIWKSDEVAMKKCRRDLSVRWRWLGGEDGLVIGGDWNANVGRNEPLNGVRDKYGVGIRNEARRDLIEWCGANGLV